MLKEWKAGYGALIWSSARGRSGGRDRPGHAATFAMGRLKLGRAEARISHQPAHMPQLRHTRKFEYWNCKFPVSLFLTVCGNLHLGNGVP